ATTARLAWNVSSISIETIRPASRAMEDREHFDAILLDPVGRDERRIRHHEFPGLFYPSHAPDVRMLGEQPGLIENTCDNFGGGGWIVAGDKVADGLQ